MGWRRRVGRVMYRYLPYIKWATWIRYRKCGSKFERGNPKEFFRFRTKGKETLSSFTNIITIVVMNINIIIITMTIIIFIIELKIF